MSQSSAGGEQSSAGAIVSWDRKRIAREYRAAVAAHYSSVIPAYESGRINHAALASSADWINTLKTAFFVEKEACRAVRS